MMPPPTKPPGGPSARPPPGATDALDKGRTPVAYRTRSKAPPLIGGDRPTTTAAAADAPRPPIPSRPPPRASGNDAATTTTTARDPSSLGVDDAIARRRAELRRLQQNRGAGGVAGLATARSRLGHRGGVGGSSGGPPTRPPPSGGGGGGGVVGATAALVNVLGAPKPKGAPAKPSPAATIARRLDASYGPPAPEPAKAAPPSARGGPPPQARPAPGKPVLGDFKRTSEIFTLGKQQRLQAEAKPGIVSMRHTSEIFNAGREKARQANDVATGAAPTPASASPGALAPIADPSPTPSPMTRSDNDGLMKSPPKSPFGQARATPAPLIPNPEKTVPVLPIMVPSLAMEPPSATSGNATGAPPKRSAPARKSVESQTRPPPSNSKVPQYVPLAKAPPAKPQQTTNQKPPEQIDSGKSTPIMSNVHDDIKSNGNAKVPTKAVVEKTPSKKEGGQLESGSSGDGKSDEKALTPNPSNMSRLMNDLQRTEQEKKEALEQVNKLKAMLEQGKRQQKEASGQFPQPQPSPAAALNGGLLDQFKEMVSTHGESAAVAWMSKQLEANDGRSLTSPRIHSRGRDGGETDLLSSVVPPLTPRSRPGSRAASPERGGGGGLLLSQSLGQALTGEAGPARGKRMTTPLPKPLNHGNETEGRAGRTQEGVEHEYLRAAAKSIPNEYGTQLASYLVRRPYVDAGGAVGADGGDNGDVWESMESYSHLAARTDYLNHATALDPSSLEILAYVEADGSVFTLTGTSNARHGKLPNISLGGGSEGENEARDEDSFDWAVFDNVEEMSRSLGRVTYIDVEGNEREYWLDSIYEEALTTRESYCMSLISAAFALKEVTGGKSVATDVLPTQLAPPMQPTSPAGQPMQPPSAVSQPAGFMQQSPTNVGAGVFMQGPAVTSSDASSTQFMPPSSSSIPPNRMQDDTKNLTPPMPSTQPELPKPEEAAAPPLDSFKPAPTQPPSEPNSDLAPPKEKPPQTPTTSDKKRSTSSTTKLPPEEEEYESADSALPFMVISLFSLLFSMMWFLVKIPFRIGSMIVSFWIAVVALRVLWLFLADDNGAWEMGAGVNYEYNMPGIY